MSVLPRHCDQEEQDTDGAAHRDSFKIDEPIWDQSGEELFTARLASSNPRRMQQDKVRILCELQESGDLRPCSSRTYRWQHCFVRIDGPRSKSVPLADVYFPRDLFSTRDRPIT